MMQGKSFYHPLSAILTHNFLYDLVYEYFISHYLAKAFESLFGSVTCLPGW